MLLDPLGPLVVRWRYLHRIAPWLARFVRAARPDSVERISIALASLLDRSNEAWRELITAANAQGVWRQSGELHSPDQAGLGRFARVRRTRTPRLVLEERQSRKCVNWNPLSPNLYRGVHA